ncbi:MAG TPA: MMPL family transporter [Candidatus Binatia bacterium]|nr:MMPL family transporter [Candidatus Binatia bacterium]
MSRPKVLACGWALVVGLMVAHAGYLWIGRRLAPDTDILALLPLQDRDPVLQRALAHRVDSARQRLMVLVGADDWAGATRAADAYLAVLAPHGDLFQFDRPLTDPTDRDWLRLFQRHRLNLLTPQQQKALYSQRQQFWVDRALTQLYSPFAGPKLGAWQEDPFGLFGGWVQARMQETPVRPREGRLFLSDGRREFVAMPMTVRLPAFSMAAQRAVLPLLEQARERAAKAVSHIEVLSAGMILHAAAASRQASHELSVIGVGSIAGIVLLMVCTFGSLSPIVLIMLPVGIGCLGALSVCWLLFDRIHLLTLVFGATLIGVAQDYGIYFLCNRASAGTAVDSSRLLRRLLPALFLTLITTLIGYLGLVLTPFPGLQQMAVFTMLGLLFAWVTVVLWFPILVPTATLTNARLIQSYAAVLARWRLLCRHRGSLFVPSCFAIAIVGLGLSRLDIQDDVRLLNNSPQHLVDDQVKISKLLDAAAPAQFYIVRGPTPEALLRREEMLRERLDPLVEQQIITGYQSISNWVPSLEVQQSRRKLLDDKLLQGGGALATLGAQIGEDAKWFIATRDHLLASAAPLTPGEFLKTPASEPWRHLWLGQVDGGYASIVALRGLTKASLAQLEHAAAGIDDAQWVDEVAGISSVLGRYRKYMSWLLLLSYVAVYGLLYPRYGRATWRVLAPTALASLVTLALLGLLGQQLQLFHILGLMLILGIGIDYSIFLHEPVLDDRIAWLAIGLSALTTLLSFGLLSLSHTPALEAFGLTLLIGTASEWILVPLFNDTTPETALCERSRATTVEAGTTA